MKITAKFNPTLKTPLEFMDSIYAGNPYFYQIGEKSGFSFAIDIEKCGFEDWEIEDGEQDKLIELFYDLSKSAASGPFMLGTVEFISE